ncbi:HAD-IB family hydrolase [Actinocrinis puniceicyclus]|uniref:HAD-IB family hydrolase n=1 Tax=Actinocrinis puniceicyclus TaxID=977794 RepID=A0A8J8BDA0_9ACTN|nr:HAD-IB family hydrolase [Actinocrinis puniceicyclus]MBS2964375.1 HAD-IB family hydrolase [Actinocrinis puniceicyclus]
MPGARCAAFFDVDETLVVDKTMFSFLRFHFGACGYGDGLYERKAAWLRRCSALGAPRQQVNRAYYRLYAGASSASLAAQGRSWFAARCARGGFFHQPAVDALRGHLARGHEVILVSGSFFACLDPIAGRLGAGDVLCTAPIVEGGRLTGEVDEPMIGEAKARAALAWMARHGIDPADCYAYGDHASDLALLRSVGNPIAVGDDPLLAAHVLENGGRRLAGAAPSAEAAA